jgi:hypothetical protein
MALLLFQGGWFANEMEEAFDLFLRSAINLAAFNFSL